MHFNQSNAQIIRTMNKTNEITNFQQVANNRLNDNIRSISPAMISSIEYNTQVNNLQLTVANEVTNNYDRRMSDCRAMDNCHTSQNRFQNERSNFEDQIYRVCEAKVPVSCGGKKRWDRERMERERDAQENVVNQLQQQFNNDLRNLDAHINQYLGNEHGLANELINEKLNLLQQELNNRNDRVKELDWQIARAWKPVHSGGGFWREDREHLQWRQSNVKEEIQQLQQLIIETNNKIH